MNLGHWQYHSKFDIIDYIGFIYKITCNITGKFYIGRKNFFTNITKAPLKGFKRKRKIKKESDWITYTSSSNELNDMILKNGKDNFTFEIMHLCTSKSEMSYYEVYYIMLSGSMINPLGLNKNCSRVPCRPKCL